MGKKDKTLIKKKILQITELKWNLCQNMSGKYKYFLMNLNSLATITIPDLKVYVDSSLPVNSNGTEEVEKISGTLRLLQESERSETGWLCLYLYCLCLSLQHWQNSEASTWPCLLCIIFHLISPFSQTFHVSWLSLLHQYFHGKCSGGAQFLVPPVLIFRADSCQALHTGLHRPNSVYVPIAYTKIYSKCFFPRIF